MIPPDIDVLVVQDDPQEVELTLRPLRELSPAARIGVARDGEEALDYLLARAGYRHRLGAGLPRLVLVDFKLPRMDGAEVLRALRASPRTGSTPIVMLVSATEPRELAQCYQLGANSCVRKPVEFPAFYAAMQAVGRYWLSLNEPPPTATATAGPWAGTRGAGDGVPRP
ncbi:MAG TPA: response regulator [Gemmatimonadales bacterium]|nr:response regulator [Gemmatimonadales bacterium]